MGGCVFKTAYTLYASTCIGRCVHNRCLHMFKRHYGQTAVHSRLTPFLFNDLLILPVPFLVNNYAYVVADLQANNFVFVDVGDADILKRLGVRPDAILTTHRHWDHSGGNKAMREAYPAIKIYGGEMDNVPDHTHAVRDGDVLTFGRLKFTAVWTPGHTRGHIVWRLHGDVFHTTDSVFTGDHLMLACCGAPFEGSVETMVTSLELMKTLPEDTWVWPGHEMGLGGLEMAAFVEPKNRAVLAKLVWVIRRREEMRCTCPSTIGEEKRYNPFLRTGEESLQTALGLRQQLSESILAEKPLMINALCFDWILQKNGDLLRLKKEIRAKEKKVNSDTNANTAALAPPATATAPTAATAPPAASATTAAAAPASTAPTAASAVTALLEEDLRIRRSVSRFSSDILLTREQHETLRAAETAASSAGKSRV